MPIFADNAQKYWDAGLQVIPLIKRDKRPTTSAWQTWGSQLIPDTEKQFWLSRYGDGNIGLPAGPASDLVFVDIDVIDPVQLALIESCLPKSPWRRVGKKGCVVAFKYNGAKSFKIKTGADQKPLVEFISTGGQVVVPPSIHPETGSAYVSERPLYEVKHLLPELSPEIETILRTALKLNGLKLDIAGVSNISDRVSMGGRDTALIKQAGLFSIDITRGRKSLKETFNDLSDWVELMAERVEGDQIDLEKGQKRIVEFLVNDVRKKNLVLPKGWDADITNEQKLQLGLDALTEDDISLDFEDIKTRFLAELKDAEELGNANTPQIIDRSLRRISRSQNVSEYEAETLLNLLKEHGGKGVTMGALRKGLKSHAHEGIEGANHTEIAEAVLDDLKDLEMRHSNGDLHEWRGSHWGKKDPNELLKHIAQRYGHLPAARRSSDHGGVIKVVNTLVAKPIQTAGGVGVNFTNGFLNSQLQLLAHDREYGATFELPYAYKPELRDKCPKFLKFLRAAWDNDEEKIEALRQSIAVTLFGLAPKFEKCFLLHGVPHSGKSVLLTVVSSLIPSVARASISPQQFSDKYKLAELQGKIMNVAGELPDNKTIQSSIFKTVISGQALTVERKNKDPFQFESLAANWFAANGLPSTKDVSDGFGRRWLIFGFYKRVPEEEKNVNLAEEMIAEEREAIVAWAVESIRDVLLSNRIVTPIDSQALAAEMTHSINPIRSWFEEEVELKVGHEMNEKVAYERYRVWTMVRAHRQRELGDFKRTMRELAGNGEFRCISSPTGEHTYLDVKMIPKP